MRELQVQPGLIDFWNWWKVARVFKPPFSDSINATRSYGRADVRDSLSAIIFRDGRFQIEHLIYPAGAHVPEHVHPNVDSLEIYLSGDMYFTLFGRPVHTWAETRELSNGASSSFGRVVPVPHNAPHAALIGPRGVSFLSVQEWLNGTVPSQVGRDWSYT